MGVSFVRSSPTERVCVCVSNCVRSGKLKAEEAWA